MLGTLGLSESPGTPAHSRATLSDGARFRIGIDVGGTFTDLFLQDLKTLRVARHKLLSTPGTPHVAPLRGIREILEQVGGEGNAIAFVGLGTTVMTNALLERKGARTGLITTAGFRDLLEIARQKRPHTFDPFVSKPAPLVTRDLRVEVRERMSADGSILGALDEESLAAAIDQLMTRGVEAIAVCFLNSYANPLHEREAARVLRERWPEGHVCVSADVLPEFREYERLSSTVVNAYLMPVTRNYLRRFESEIAALGVSHTPFVMNSGGGIMTPDQAGERPIDTLFSGPSGGVSGAVHVATRAGCPNIITFDMGGTSTDVCLVQNGKAQVSHTRVINGVPLKAAALDVHTVGAGGSSIAHIDAGGMLRVGPHSAGARPGPACYMLGGEEPTTTTRTSCSAGSTPTICWAERSHSIRNALPPRSSSTSRDRKAFRSWKRRHPSSRSPTPTWRMPCVSCRSNADSIPAISCWSRSAARGPCMLPRSRASSGSDRARSARARCAVRDGRAGERPADGRQPDPRLQRSLSRLLRDDRRRLSRA